MNDELKRKNKRIIVILICAAVGMFGFGFALVPIYRMFCQVTGLNGKNYTIDKVQQTLYVDKDRTLTITFIATKNEMLPWDFRANDPVVKIHPGEMTRVSFHAKNKTLHEMTVQAIPSIVPGVAAKYLHKTECFCFKQQTFAPGEAMDMPILFHIDKELPKRIKHITVSYTMFDIKMASATNIQKVGRVH